MVGAVAADLDAQRGDLAQAAEVGLRRGRAGHVLPRPLRQHGVAEWIIEPHVDARRAADAVAGDAEARQRAQHGFFQPVHVFLDEDAAPPQVDQRVRHHLVGAVVGDLPAAVGGHHVRRGLGDEVLHRLEGGGVVRAAQETDLHLLLIK